MIDRQLTPLNHKEQASPPPENLINTHLSLDEIDQQISTLEERISKGKTLIENYQQEHGVENMAYRRHLQALKTELEPLKKQRVELANRILSFKDSKYKKALTAFNELMILIQRKEFDTPKYKEQEELVRKMMKEDEQLFELLYFSKDQTSTSKLSDL